MINFSTALEMLKAIRAAANQSNDAHIKQGLLDLQGQLLNLQVQVLEQQVESRSLQSEIVRLRECLATERKLERVFDVYMLVESPENRRGPYCVGCWNKKQRLQPLVEAGNGMGYCPACKDNPRIALSPEVGVNAT